MAMQFLAFLGRHLRAFRGDRCGNVAIIFGITIVPLFGAAGVAVDYTRASSTRAAMQSALDSTALILSKEAEQLKKDSKLEEQAEKYFLANFRRPEGHHIKVKADLDEIGDSQFELTLEARGRVDTTIARVLGDKVMKVDVTSRVAWGQKRLEVALALDNTGSMAGVKMQELKTASTSLLNVLQKVEKERKGDKKKNDIKVAIVPFDYTVNIGTQGDSDFVGWGIIGKQNWLGCIGDRASPFDVTDRPPSDLDLLSLFPAVACADKPVAKIQPLTSKWSDLTAKINEMEANGNTNLPVGLAWAWHALTPSTPLKQADEPKFNLQKTIILLTDGLNTENRFGETAALIDARTKKTCENIKAANIEIYTVRVIDGNADLLKNCATQPDMFYDVQDAKQLNSVFENIAAKLAKLHIAR